MVLDTVCTMQLESGAAIQRRSTDLLYAETEYRSGCFALGGTAQELYSNLTSTTEVIPVSSLRSECYSIGCKPFTENRPFSNLTCTRPLSSHEAIRNREKSTG